MDVLVAVMYLQLKNVTVSPTILNSSVDVLVAVMYLQLKNVTVADNSEH